MPPMTAIGTFLRAVRNRRTHTTEVLDDVFANPSRLQNDPHYQGPFQDQGHLDTLDDRCIQELNAFGPLTTAEINHINEWPAQLKEALRQALVEAIKDDRRVRFYWKLHHPTAEATSAETGGDADIVVTFESPEANVAIVAGQVQVGVGGPP